MTEKNDLTIWLNQMVQSGKDFQDAVQKPQCAGQTKRAIIEAALEEFALRSVDGARTREIAKKAGVNHAAINYHFGGKREMYLNIIKIIVSKFEEKFTPIYAEIDAFLKSENRRPDEARRLIKKFLLLHHCIYNDPNFKNFHLMIRREEAFPTEAFNIVFSGGFKPMHEAFIALIDVVTGRKLTPVKLSLLAISLIAMNTALTSCKTAFLILNGRERLDDSDVEMFGELISENVDKILK